MADGFGWLILLVAAVAAGAAVMALIGLRKRSAGEAAKQSATDAAKQSATDAALAQLTAAQTTLVTRLDQLTGTIGQIATDQNQRHAALTNQLNERLDAVGKRVGDSLSEQNTKTTESLGKLQERLVAIDAAQKNITDLSSQVVSLQDILANKQARGAFGEGQMRTIVSDTLPAGTFAFNAALSNGTRPDCRIDMPKSELAIVIDAKFPRESFDALASAESAEAKRAGETRVRTEVKKHIDDIAGKYLIPGETQDPALMFVPAESIYSTVFADFFDIVQYAQKKRVVIVSPNMLMLAVNTIRALMRDQKMREQAHVIQEEVSKLLGDVRLLSDRTASLKRHFGQAEDDIRKIEISSDKIVKRGEKIEGVEIGEAGDKGEVIEATARPALVQT